MHRQELVDLYSSGSFGSSNPYLSEKDVLLVKLRDGTITYDEAERLRWQLLQEQAQAAAKNILAIAGLLLLLKFVSEVLKPE